MWGQPGTGPVPALFSVCVGPAGGSQLCVGSWPSAVMDFLPTEEWPVSTPEKSPAWPGGWVLGRGDSARLTSVCQAPAPLHTVAWVTLPLAFSAPPVGRAQRPGVRVASSPRGLGPEPWTAPPLPRPHPQDLSVPSLCPLGHLSSLKNWAEGHGRIRGLLPPQKQSVERFIRPCLRRSRAISGAPSSAPHVSSLWKELENFCRGGA